MVPESDSKFIVYGLTEPGNVEALRYVGKTSNLKRRIQQHKTNLGPACHKSNWIKSLIAKGQTFEVIVLDRCDSAEELSEREVYLIALYRWCGFDLVNTYEPAGPGRMTMSAESREKISKSNTGKVRSVEVRARMSAARKGQPSPNRGVPMSEEQKLKLSIAKTGTKASDETRAKMSASQIGKEFSAEHRAALSASRIGMKFSESHKENIRAARTGTKATEEAKANLSASQLRRLEDPSERKRFVEMIAKGHTPEAIAKSSASRMGHEVSAETRARIGSANKGKCLGKSPPNKGKKRLVIDGKTTYVSPDDPRLKKAS